MKAEERIKAISEFVQASYRRMNGVYRDYPRDILELIIFHKIHFHAPEQDALQCFRRLKTAFVDWNEVRISSLREIQEVFYGTEDSLGLAIFVKDLLEHLHRQNQSTSLEFLADKNLADIRRYLRGIKGLDPATIDLVLRIRKEYPVLPMSAPMELTLTRLGVVRPHDNRQQKERYLHTLVDQSHALSFHHFFLKHSREICPPEEDKILCPDCGIRRSCTYFGRRRRRSNGKTNHKP